jgi:rRNA maturation RNase YbeY
MEIEVASENSSFAQHRAIIKHIILWMCEQLSLTVQSINVIFTNDFHLRKIHKDYLRDDTPTDVITFNLGTSDHIEAEIYISAERAMEQAVQYQVTDLHEVCRLVVHALLHLAGFNDKSGPERQRMKQEENKYVELISERFLANSLSS